MSQQSDQVPNYEQNETQAFPGAAGPRRGRRSTTPVASYTADQRLAGNPRKQKVPPESRKRVVRACNNCNVRKGRCSGETPCRQCSISGRECIYSPPPDLIKVPQADYEALQKEKAEHEALRKEVAELKRQLELTRDSHAGPLTPPADTSPPSQLSNDALALSSETSPPHISAAAPLFTTDLLPTPSPSPEHGPQVCRGAPDLEQATWLLDPESQHKREAFQRPLEDFQDDMQWETTDFSESGSDTNGDTSDTGDDMVETAEEGDGTLGLNAYSIDHVQHYQTFSWPSDSDWETDTEVDSDLSEESEDSDTELSPDRDASTDITYLMSTVSINAGPVLGQTAHDDPEIPPLDHELPRLDLLDINDPLDEELLESSAQFYREVDLSKRPDDHVTDLSIPELPSLVVSDSSSSSESDGTSSGGVDTSSSTNSSLGSSTINNSASSDDDIEQVGASLSLYMDRTEDDGRMLSDGSGSRVYQGRSSGAIFLDKLKMVIAVAMPLAGAVGKADEPSPGSGFVRSVGSYQTGDSKPFDLSRIEEPAELIPPPPEEEVNQARWDIRTFLGDGNCSYQCGGVLYWPLTAADRGRLRPSKTSLDYILDSPEERVGEKVKEGNPMALSYMALALGTVLKLAGPGSKASGRLGEDSFARAWKHLADPTQLTKSSLDDIASMALVAIYLVENNRRDGAYCWVSAALATCEKRGMHTRTLYRESDEVEVRVFWTVYLLEKWLSCLLGRPTMLQLNDVSAPMPDIRPGFPPPDGLRAHIELSNVTQQIVYKVFHDQTKSEKQKHSADFIRHAAKYLNHWLKCLPKEMRLGEDPVAITLPDFTGWAEPRQVYCLGNDRAKWALHMSYNQLIILSIRPAFLVAVQKAIASIMCEDGPWWFEGHTMSREFYRCTEAATRNIRLGWLMRLYSPYRKLMVADLHHIFNATVVLLMHQMVFVNQTTQFRTDVNWAINQVFEVEAATGCEYAMDCLAVLKDLHFIALRLRNVIFEPYDRDEAWSPNGVLREFITHRERADSGTCNYVFPRLPIEAMARFEAWEVLSEWRNLDLEDGACYRSFFY